MTIKDFLSMGITVDVCDDYDESLYIAFCGPVELTPAGLEAFAPVLDLEVMPQTGGPWILCGVEDDNTAAALRHLFYGAAGYVSTTEYNKLFGGPFEEDAGAALEEYRDTIRATFDNPEE